MLRAILTAAIGCLVTAALAPQAADAQEPSRPIGLATYYECDITKEARADTLVAEVLAPLFDEYVSQGKLLSWGWNAHVLGGNWRRLFYVYATDMTALMSARAEFLTELGEQHPAETAEFSAICYTHDDYVWRTLIAP